MDSSLPHVVIFPFFSKGHTIPLLHLANLLHRRRLAATTFITTPGNASFIRRSLSGTSVAVIELPFPIENFPDDLPSGVESTDQLLSMSLFIPFVTATKLLKPHFEQALSELPAITFMISDMFFTWAVGSAARFAIPTVVFMGVSKFATTMNNIVARHKPHAGVSSPDEPFPVPGFPQVQLTTADFSMDFVDPRPSTPHADFLAELRRGRAASHAVIDNTIYELEAAYVDCWNRDFGPRSWCVGPLCLAQPETPAADGDDDDIMQWLDSMSAMKRPVLYVAFGTQAEVSSAQVEEIATGMEESGLDYLWVVRSGGEEIKERGRGRIVRKWVNQLGILRHESVKGFVSHCGWNSVLESMSAGVPVLAWPMMADQPLNAKLVVDELKIGLRIRARGGSKGGLVVSEDVRDMARELVVGERGRAAREKAERLAELATKAMADGGSSASALKDMIQELSEKREALQNAS